MNTDIAGKYRHYKGNEYEVLCEGLHTETEERLVIYKALYEPYQVWARPYDMFFENAVVEGGEIPRFTKIED
jgi:hypothetical protein